MSTPTLEALGALNGRIFAMLSDEEQAVLDFYRKQSRKFDAAVTVINAADPDEMAGANSRQAEDAVLKSANSHIAVTIGPSAQAAWSARATD